MAPWVIDISFLYVSIKLYINLLKHLKLVYKKSVCLVSGQIGTLFIHIAVIWFSTREYAAVWTGDNHSHNLKFN